MNFELETFVIEKENMEALVKLMNKLLVLMPKNKDKITSLNEIILYLNSLINGDSLTQFSTYAYLTDSAKKALDELKDYVQENTLELLKEEKKELTNELTELEQKKDNITDEINKLGDKKDKINTNLEELENKYDEKKKTLDEEIHKKEEIFNDLNTIIRNLRSELDAYNQKIANLDNPEPIVTWNHISKDDPIYNTNYQTIDNYVNSLKLIYCEKMNCSLEKAEIEFKKYCPELDNFTEMLKTFDNNEVQEIAALRTILSYSNWNEEAETDTKMLESFLRNMKLPQYYNVDKKSSLNSLQPTNIKQKNVNLDILKRELYFQKLILEATAAKKIAEYNLQLVINTLGQFVPRNIDLNTLLIQSGISLPTIDVLNEEPLTKKKEL